MGAVRRAPAAFGMVVLLLAVLAATTSGGMTWIDGPSRSSNQETTSQGHPGDTADNPSEVLGGDRTAPVSPTDPRDFGWLRALSGLVLAAVLVAFALAFLAMFRVAFRRRRLTGAGRRRSALGMFRDGEEPAEPEDLRTLVGEQLAALGTGAPRNAVIAAWVQLEEFALAHGLPRDPSDTPAEFVARALAAYDLDGTAIERLAELYREARFSRHPLVERHRDEARDCLERLIHAKVAR